MTDERQPAAFLELKSIAKSYDAAPVLRGVSLDVAGGTVTALLGPSGCGKTTLLRIVAGLERADGGAVLVEGEAIDQTPPHQRGFGLMFQDYALFPHLDVLGNVAFGLRMQGLGAQATRARVSELLALVGMAGYEERRVYELSGGERQRVALARALAPRPRLLMLDEPLAALDRALRERLQDELREILRAVGVTALYVTHDQEEAFALADTVALLNAGRLEQAGPPEGIYRHPASPWAARFFGLGNLVAGHWRADGAVETPLGALACRTDGRPGPAGATANLVIYPDAASLAREGDRAIVVELIEAQFRGRASRAIVRHASGVELTFELPRPPGRVGDTLAIALDPAGVYALPGMRDGGWEGSGEPGPPGDVHAAQPVW
jgi:ABC-type Fe3+/spermidine/putrescine transport system ATPase subunit